MELFIKLSIPFIGAFIGWITNVIAIKLLFRPYKPIFGIQGLLPKYQKEIAERLGVVVKKYLLNDDSLIQSIKSLKPEEIEDMAEAFIKHSGLNPIIRWLIINFLMPSGEELKRYLQKGLKNVPNILSVDKIVVDKIKSFDLRELEKIVYEASGREIRFIKITGGVLGFLIGILQVVITTVL